jgi:hypothetical protein
LVREGPGVAIVLMEDELELDSARGSGPHGGAHGGSGGGVGWRSMASAWGSGSSSGPVQSSWRWWLDWALIGVGQGWGVACNRGSRWC